MLECSPYLCLISGKSELVYLLWNGLWVGALSNIFRFVRVYNGLLISLYPTSIFSESLLSTLIFSVSNNCNGVGVVLDKDLGKKATNFVPLSYGWLLLNLARSIINIYIIKTYAPSADKSDEELKLKQTGWQKKFHDWMKGKKWYEKITHSNKTSTD